MFKSLIDLWRSSMDITELNKNKRLSSTKNLILSKDEKLFEFLSEDFRDTASHLRDTDRKIEFTFQLYAGAFSLLLTIVISFFASALGSQNWKEQYNIYIMWAVLFLLIVVWFFTWWAFEYSIKGTKMKALYINRMNFLRNEIYKHLGLEMMNKPAFMYVNQFLPLDTLRKVGMLDMFPLGLRYMMIFLPIPIFVIAYNILKLLGVSVHWLTFFVPPIFVVLVMWYTKRAWVNIVRDTKDKIEKSWKSLDEG